MAGGASISARSEGTGDIDPADAGNIVIGPDGAQFPNRVIHLESDSAITTAAQAASGGNIFINAGPLLEVDGSLTTVEPYRGAASGEIVLLRDSEITTSVTSGTGSGGNITIDPVFVVLDASRIVARADAGAGGNIVIRADFFVPSADSVVDASAGPAGIDGTVLIESPAVDLVSPLATLPRSFLDASGLMRERCAARPSGEPVGSFLVSPRGLRPSPDAYLASPAASYGTAAEAPAGGAGRPGLQASGVRCSRPAT